MRRLNVGLALAAACLLLSGCVGTPSPFDRARTADDAVPAVAAKYLEGGDLRSSRYQGDADGHALYLLKGTGEMRVCLVYTDGTADGSLASCGGGDWLKIKTATGAEFEVKLSGFTDAPRKGDVAVSPWVRQTSPGRGQ